MATADTINSIRTHLTDDYIALEQLGVSVEDRNIENIKDMANQIYAKFPKTSYAEGSNITLSNTLKGKLDFEDGIVGYGDTKQEGTPTPDNPQDIEVVRGKNLLDSELEKGTYNDNTGEQIATDENYRNVSPIKVCPNTTYTFSINGVKQKYCVYYYDSSNNFISWIPAETGTFTTPNNCYYINFRCYVADYTSDFANLKIQLEKGSTATSYLPYNTLEVVERGKNYCGFNSVSSTGMGVDYIIDKSEITLNGTTNGGGYIYTSTTNFITIPKGTYKLSGYILGGSYNYVGDIEIALKKASDNTKVLTLYKTHYDNQATITLTEDTDLYYGIYTNGSNNVLNNFKIGIQIEEGSTATTYEPYQTPQTYQLSLGEYEFAKIGNYVDTIEYDVDEDKVYKNEAINKVLLKTLTWKISSVGTNSYGTASLLSYIGKVATDINIICSHATGIIFNDRNWLTNTTIYDETIGYVVFRNTSFTSFEDFTTFLNNNNVYAYYVLATATREEITGTLKDQIKALYNSQSFNGTTIIEIDGQLPLIIKVRALKGE